MKRILVPVKRVPDYLIKIAPNEEGTDIRRENLKWILNPFDEIAVEQALRFRDQFPGLEIVVCTIGPKEATEQLRTAMAMGADRAILVVSDSYIDSHVAHLVLSKIYAKEPYDLVLMGKQSIDSDAAQTGQLLAARLGLAQATFASAIDLKERPGWAKVTREVDGGLETVSVLLPAVITTDLRLNDPRLPTLPGILKAKKKPLEEISIADLGVDTEAKVMPVKFTKPLVRSAGVKVNSVKELVEKLQEARAI